VRAYGYERSITAEIEHLLAQALASLGRTEQATLQEDVRGTDFHYLLGDLAVQVRARFDRGKHFQGIDITFRTTEPAMIARHEYAPLMLYVWLEAGLADFAYLVDVYAMADAMDRGRIAPFEDRPAVSNGDGTYFKEVAAGDLFKARALLGNGDRYAWTATPLSGLFRLRERPAPGLWDE
jgi:hypothetical protein